MLTEVGFAGAEFHGWTGYVTSSRTQGGLVTAHKPVGTPAADGTGPDRTVETTEPAR